jgi:2-keto-4-pentenoate hydratase/2-oxohepta-3-ene-1,7-dioic acid hydratase in catechol pathway
VEYEGEIGIVIGRALCDASEDEAIAGVGGVLAINDVTARDLQRRDSQWTRAKGFDTFCPVGPVSREFDDLASLEVVTRVNGVERQRGRSSEMAFSIPMLLAYISRIMTLEPGDLVATGTPSGVGPLAAGDEVEIEVVGLSSVRSPVRASA